MRTSIPRHMQKFRPPSIAISTIVILWMLAAFALREIAPWFFWCTIIALPATVLVTGEREFMSSSRGRKILGICGLLFTAHISWAVIWAQYYNPALPETYWKDDHNYFNEAAALAAAWSDGHFPEFWRKGAPPYLGTLHTGYHRPLSTLFLVFGPSTLVGLFLNAFCASLFPLLAALVSRYIWESGPLVIPKADKDPVMVAAILTALHPTQFYWSSFLLKDTYVAFMFLLSMALIFGALHQKSIPYAVASLMLLPYLFTIRIYTALSVIAGTACVPVLWMKTRSVVIFTTAMILVFAMLINYTAAGYHLSRQMLDSFVALAPSGIDSPVAIFIQIVSGIPRLFLSPYAWLRFDSPNPMYGLYPGMWYLYLVGYPLAFAGLYAALRKNIRYCVIPLAAFGLGALLFLTATYEGNASRQRFYLEYVILIFAAFGLAHPNKWWIGGILIAEAAFGIGQVLALR